MRLIFALLAVPYVMFATDDENAIIDGIRNRVAEQVSKSGNYACVETIERSYFSPLQPAPPACEATLSPSARKKSLEDRLRLDVAVSERAEIYSWHGENKYSSSVISKVVRNGAISSGSFVGFLRNIFMLPGIRFVYLGKVTEDGVEAFKFNYVVSKKLSQYSVLGANSPAVIAFHGTFTANVANSELVSLSVVADDIPFGSNICATDSAVHYRVVTISGRQTLIPQTYELHLDDDNHEYSISRGEYSNCHEFRAESSVRFDVAAADLKQNTQADSSAPLSAGIDLHVVLKSAIDDSSYTGDPVEAMLADSISIPRTSMSIPRGASLHGTITELEHHLLPESYFLLRIQFASVTFDGKTFPMRAIHLPTGKEADTLSFLTGGILIGDLKKQVTGGTIVFKGKHFRVDQKFKGDWRTFQAESQQQ